MHWWGQRSCRGQLGCSQFYRELCSCRCSSINNSHLYLKCLQFWRLFEIVHWLSHLGCVLESIISDKSRPEITKIDLVLEYVVRLSLNSYSLNTFFFFLNNRQWFRRNKITPKLKGQLQNWQLSWWIITFDDEEQICKER